MMKKYIVILISYFVFLTATAHASNLQISPTRIYLHNDKSVQSLLLVNKSIETMYLQLSLRKWSQTLQKDVYTPSNEILATPPMIMLEPSQSQIVRIALRKPIANHLESAYRLFIDEIPSINAALKPGITFNMRFGIPIFIRAAQEVQIKNALLSWEIKSRIPHAMTFKLSNHHNKHLQLTHLILKDRKSRKVLLSQEIFLYILPHQSRLLTVTSVNINTSDMEIQVQTDQGMLASSIS